MMLLFICGIAFATAFVLKLISGNSWLSFGTVVVGFAALALLGGSTNTLFVLAAILLTAVFGAAWGVVGAKMLKERRLAEDRKQLNE